MCKMSTHALMRACIYSAHRQNEFLLRHSCIHSVAWQPKFHSLMSLDAAWRQGGHKVVRVCRPATENRMEYSCEEEYLTMHFVLLSYICAQLHVIQFI